MERRFVSFLPRGMENVNYMVVSPDGGLFSSINDVLFEFATYIDLELDYNGTISKIRVTPRLDEIVQDPERRDVYYFNDNVGVFLDEKGEETANSVTLFVMLNAQVTHEGMPIGTLRMWRTIPSARPNPEKEQYEQS